MPSDLSFDSRASRKPFRRLTLSDARPGAVGIVPILVGRVQRTDCKGLPVGGLRFAYPPYRKANASLWDDAVLLLRAAEAGRGDEMQRYESCGQAFDCAAKKGSL